MRRSFLLFVGFFVVIAGVFSLTGSHRAAVAARQRPKVEVRVEPKINVAPVFVRPRAPTFELPRLNPEWLNAVVQVKPLLPSAGRGSTLAPGLKVFSGILAGSPRTVVTWLPSGGTEKMEVTFRDGSVRSGKLEGRDAATGIAVVRLDESAPMALDWRDGPELQIGDEIYVLGFESGVAAIRAQVAMDSTGGLAPVMLDREVPEGWLGGALIDGDGRLAGIVLPKDRARMSLGSPVLAGQELMWTVDSLLEGLPVRRVDLGMNLGTRVVVGDGGRGWKIQGVTPGGLADQAGVRVGEVLVAVNEREIAHPGQLPYAAGLAEPGQPVSLELENRGSRRTVLVPVEL